MIVSVVELEDYMSGIKLSPTYGQINAAEMVIAGVQGEIETYLNRPIELVTITETLAYERNGMLPEPRVTPVVSTATLGWTVRNGQLVPPYGFTYQSILEYVQTGYTVTYVGGLNGPTIPHLRLQVLRIAAREMSNKHDDSVGLVAGELTRSRPNEVPEALNDDDRKRIDRYRRRTVL